MLLASIAGKLNFAAAVFDPNYEAFIIYVAIFNIYFDLAIEKHFSKKAQIA